MKKSIFTAMAVATLVTILFSGTSSAGNKSSNKSTYNHSGNSTGIKGYTPPSKFKRQRAKNSDWRTRERLRGLLPVPPCKISKQACIDKYSGMPDAYKEFVFVDYRKEREEYYCYVQRDIDPIAVPVGPAC
jgi:hypothetical protein